MIQHRTVPAPASYPVFRPLPATGRGEPPVGGGAAPGFKPSLILAPGKTFDGPRGLEVATVESGAVLLEVTTARGLEFCLSRLGPGDIVLPLDAIANPAFALSYRIEDAARISWLHGRSPATGRAPEAERMVLQATTELLGTCIRMIHELACLPASHRLYCGLLRLARCRGGPLCGTAFRLPPQAAMAGRLCATRETISRELSFLRRNGVISGSKDVTILKPDFLLNRVAGALNLADAAEVWQAIGVIAH